MSVEKLLQMGGVQMMLGNLLKAAAPQLADQVNEIAKVIVAFKEQSDRNEATLRQIENQLCLIRAHLGITLGDENATGKSTENNRGLAGGPYDANFGLGKQTG